MAVIARAGDTIFVGLEEENLTRLRADMPFAHHMHEVGKPFQLVIFYGKTGEDLHRIMMDLSGPDTVGEDHRDRKKN